MTEAPIDGPTFDCRACGACCRVASDGVVLVSADDLVRWKREGAEAILASLVEGHFSQQAFASTESGACVHLGLPNHPNNCSIYATRGESCHALVPGSSQCLSYRRSAGMES